MKTSTKINYKSEVMQICGGSGGSSSSPIQLDISQGTSGLDVGDTKTYTYGGNTMKVKYQKENFTADSHKFKFYIHSLAAGGPFTLNKEININNNPSGNTAPLPESVNNVYEVYYYKNTANNGALKIKTSSDAKIFYSTNVGDTSTAWTEYTGTNPPDTATERELKALVTKIKDRVEIKVDKHLLCLY